MSKNNLLSKNNLFKCTFYLLLFLNIFFLSSIISYQITVRGEMVVVPDLFGKTLEEAKQELAKEKLVIIQSEVQLHEYLEDGKIISQDILPNSRVKINKQVKVILSSGKEKIVIPQFLGRSLQTVSNELKDIGLRKGNISHVHTSKYAAGKIIAQFPLPFEEAGKNFRISFLVSQGEKEKKYLMPDLLGKHSSSIIAKLKELEFNIGDIRYSFYPGLDTGIIINQFPHPGARIQKRNLITLEVSK